MPILAMFTAILISGGSGGATLTPTPPAATFAVFSLIDKPAPPFQLASLEGTTIDLGTYRGGWVIVNLWATWCLPCKEEMPLLQSFQDGTFAAANDVPGGVRLITINRAEDAPTIREFMTELNLSMSVAMDTDGRVTTNYGGVNLPMTYFIDPEGVVRYRHIGGLRADDLDGYLKAMAERR